MNCREMNRQTAPNRQNHLQDLEQALERSSQAVATHRGSSVVQAMADVARRAMELYLQEIEAIKRVRAIAAQQGLTLAELLNQKFA